MDRPPLVKFHGRLRDLIPAGFTFQKLFARNYRSYWKETTENGDRIIVWQHLGGYVEINDWYGLTHLIVNAILGDAPWCGDFGRFAVDKANRVLVPFEMSKHSSVIVYPVDPYCLDAAGREAARVRLKAHTDRWRDDRLDGGTIATLRDMADRGWITHTPTPGELPCTRSPTSSATR